MQPGGVVMLPGPRLVQRSAGYDDLEAFCFFTKSLLAAQYLRIRSDTARRFAGVRPLCLLAPREGTGAFSFAGRATAASLDDASGLPTSVRFVATLPAVARFGGVAAAL